MNHKQASLGILRFSQDMKRSSRRCLIEVTPGGQPPGFSVMALEGVREHIRPAPGRCQTRAAHRAACFLTAILLAIFTVAAAILFRRNFGDQNTMINFLRAS
jgi:hypothetical protein